MKRDEAIIGAPPPVTAPFDAEQEKYLLGACLSDFDGFADVDASGVRPADFFVEFHQTIFSAMKACHGRGESVNRLTAAAELSRREQLETVGGAQYLQALASGYAYPVPTLKAHIRAVLDFATKRQAAEAAENTSLRLLRDPGDARRVIAEGQSRMATIQARLAPQNGPAAVLEALQDPTDAGNAELLARRYGDRLRFDHSRQRWLVWREHWWGEDADGETLRLALECTKYRYDAAWDLPGEEAQRAAAKAALNGRQHRKLTAALAIAKVLPPLADTGDWDTDPSLLGVANGVVDLRTGKLLPGSPEQRITQHVPLPYDPAATCPRWERLVLEVCDDRAELAEYVRLASGYSLTGETSEQCLFVLQGPGSTGKSTLLAPLVKTSGPYGRTASFEAFTDPPGHLEALAVLAGARFVTSSETRENTRLNEQRLKVLSHGNDQVAARLLYGHEFTFIPRCKLWLGLNHRPRVQDDSTGFWRSVRLLPFDRVFTREGDPTLEAILEAELPGILAWRVRAARDWYAGGLPQVADVQSATDAWQRETNPLMEWLETCCVERADCETPPADLWASYLDWAEEQRIPAKERLTHRAFSNRLTARFGQSVTVKREGRTTRVYRGVGVQL